MPGVPTLTREYIDKKAEAVLRWANKWHFNRPRPTSVADVVEKLQKQGRVEVSVTTPLGVDSKGGKVFGLCVFKPPLILIDPTLVYGGPTFRFVLAHELGHFVLHRHLDLNWGKLDEPRTRVVDSRRNFFLFRKQKRTDRDWLDWQANEFAIALLVPRISLVQAIWREQASLGINRQRGTIFVDGQRQNQRDYFQILARLQATFKVSLSMLRGRLFSAGVLEDVRTSGLKNLDRFAANSANDRDPYIDLVEGVLARQRK